MRNLFIYFILLCGISAFAASPTFQSFDTNYFGTNGNNITIKLSGIAAAGGVTTNEIYSVALTGSDSTNTPGTLAAPWLTLSNAVARTRGQRAVILIRGGDYWNLSASVTGFSGTISGYPNEVAKVWFGSAIASTAFAALTNGIYTNKPSATFSNLLCQITNNYNGIMWPNGIPIWQSNAVFGAQVEGLNYIPSSAFSTSSGADMASQTNRMPHTPLMHATSIQAMVATNALWWFTNGLLYVKFAVSNVPGTLFLPSTNSADCLIAGGDQSTDVKVQNIQVYGGYAACRFDGSAAWEAEGIYAFGSYRGGINNERTFGWRHGSVFNCEIAGSYDGLCFFGHTSSASQVRIVGVLGHDYFGDDGLWIGPGVDAVEDNCTLYGGTNGMWGFICDGSSVYYNNCKAIISVGFGAWQCGNNDVAAGKKSFIQLNDCYVENRKANENGIRVDDVYCTVVCINSTFNSDNPIFINTNPGTKYVTTIGCLSVYQNTDSSGFGLIQGTGIGSFSGNYLNKQTFSESRQLNYSGFETTGDGSIFSRWYLIEPTSTPTPVGIAFPPPGGNGFLWNSNYCLYWVTDKCTNYVVYTNRPFSSTNAYIVGRRNTNSAAGGFSAQRAKISSSILLLSGSSGIARMSLVVERPTMTNRNVASFGGQVATNEQTLSDTIDPNDVFIINQESTGTSTAGIITNACSYLGNQP